MKLILAVLLGLSIIGLVASALGPALYKSKTGRKKLLVYQPALVFTFLAIITFVVVGWQSTQYDQSIPSSSESPLSGQYVQKTYPVYNSQYDFIKVVDSNHIKVRIKDHPTLIRLIGVKPFIGANQNCLNEQAMSRLDSLLKGQKVELEGDDSLTDKTKEDALLRYVIVKDSDMNEKIISSGFAQAEHSNNTYKYQSKLIKAESDAKAKGSGLWAAAACRSVATAAPTGSVLGASSNRTSSGSTSSTSSKRTNSSRQSSNKGASNSGGNNSQNNGCVLSLPVVGCVLKH